MPPSCRKGSEDANGILYNCAGLSDLFSIEGINLSVQGDQQNTASAPNGDVSVFTSEKQGFSFNYDSSLSAKWDDEDGAYVYTETDGSIPYLLVWLINTGDNDGFAFDTSDLFYFYAEDMKAEYGSRLKSFEDNPSEYTVAGKTLLGAKYVYELDGYTIELIVYLDVEDDFVTQYTRKHVQGSGESTMAALEMAVSSFKLSGGNTGGNTPTTPNKPQNTDPTALGSYTVTKNEPIKLQTALYDGGFFSLQLPTGWVIETTGEYTLFGFHAYDPNNPERQIFFYCKHHPLLKSMEAKNYFEKVANMVGGSYRQSADTPVLLEPTTDYFFYIYNDYNNFLNKYGLNHQLPVMNDLSILEKYPNSTPTAPNTLDNSIVRASFYSANSVECEGLMAGQVVNYGTDTYSVPGIDMGTYAVYNCNGVIAPAGEFNELREQLLACLSSFTFTEDYVRQAQQHVAEETSAILAMSCSMQAAYDSYNAAWSARQTSYDIISQKNSDATLGYDRLYDPDTGEIYRAELGFYDSYDINRDQYSNPNLQIINSSTEQYYLDGVDYYISK